MRSLAAELLIRVLIVKRTSLRNEAIVFGTTQFGKPFLREHSLDSLEFNLSHAGEWVVCAIGSSPVGIDIEEIASCDDGMARHVLSDEEYMQFCRKDEVERRAYFFDLWTLKESYLKAIGAGLSLPLNLFSFALSDGEIMFRNDHNGEAAYFKQFHPDDKYKLSVCSTVDLFPECVTFWSFDRLYENSLLFLN
ncbi:4'-phosphopantetheinyl transferase superfamily protein [Cohnella fermenti]|uniref:4'-phosphopantetheinyl transferase superfamily protein n=2 Tax=Cohnella fermenti TaxID=2565925 RepID=A0A4S4BQ96_9BACL|nr:4'-phosphopantetheinyl transferase superfamily protein [Cohnella fermenti]THF76597.1 4'-phosphopantetheinyl transferase superfamily protein [Cohnella fermenti]